MKPANPMQLKMIFLSIVAVLSLVALISYFTTDKKTVEDNQEIESNNLIRENDLDKVDTDKIKEIEENYTEEKEDSNSIEEEHLHEEITDYEVKYKEQVGKNYTSIVDAVEELATLYVTDESDLNKWGAFLSEELLDEKKQLLTDGFVRKVIDAQAFPIEPNDNQMLQFEVRVVWTIASNGEESGKETWVTISYDPSKKLATELMIQ